jgi:hypothetical protein
MFIRFTTLYQDEQSHSPQGIFQAAIEMRDTWDLADHELDQINESLDWLNMHLKSPACLSAPDNFRAISWFHPRAHKPMQYVWQMVYVLEEHGILIRLHKTADPGIVIYEDGWQVAAKPRKKSFGGRKGREAAMRRNGDR